MNNLSKHGLPMKVLILGCNGMLGHKCYQVLSTMFDIIGTIRGSFADISKYGFFSKSKVFCHIDVRQISQVERVIEEASPEAVINCTGIVKARREINDRLISIWINSLFPHQLNQICRQRGLRLVHISTDCIFSGKKGNYREEEPADAQDIYGKTKYIGEIQGEGAITIRTSLIGRELHTSNGLIEWFLSNRGGEVNGFSNAIFSGFPTLHFVQILGDILKKYPELNGIYHVSSEPISKFELLNLIKNKMGLNIKIRENSEFFCNRSLDSTTFRTKTGFVHLSWDQMIEEFARDVVQYEQWRR